MLFNKIFKKWNICVFIIINITATTTTSIVLFHIVKNSVYHPGLTSTPIYPLSQIFYINNLNEVYPVWTTQLN